MARKMLQVKKNLFGEGKIIKCSLGSCIVKYNSHYLFMAVNIEINEHKSMKAKEKFVASHNLNSTEDFFILAGKSVGF